MGKINILLAHPDAIISNTIAAITRRDGFVLTVAADGTDAADKIACENFDLVICALTLPGLSGSEVACRLRRSKLNASASFTLLTGEENPRLIGNLFSLDQIDSYFPEPVSFIHMSAHIRMMLNTKKCRPTIVKEVALLSKV